MSQGAATPMAVVQQLDPIYFDFTESSVERLEIATRQLQSGQLRGPASGEPKVTLQLPDGSTYPDTGKLLFQDVSVDPSSGMVTLRAEFPNPDRCAAARHVRRRHAGGRRRAKYHSCSPTRRRDRPDRRGVGHACDIHEFSSARTDRIGRRRGNGLDSLSGLKPGDRVIVEGLLKAQPGMHCQSGGPCGAPNSPCSPANNQGKRACRNSS